VQEPVGSSLTLSETNPGPEDWEGTEKWKLRVGNRQRQYLVEGGGGGGCHLHDTIQSTGVERIT
jgi:hypothetical protein